MKYKILLMATAAMAFADMTMALETSSKSYIDRFITYSTRGDGEIYLSLEKNGEICSNGYYANKSTQGYKEMYSMLLAAHYAKKPVTIRANEKDRWSSSKSPVCAIDSVESRLR